MENTDMYGARLRLTYHQETKGQAVEEPETHGSVHTGWGRLPPSLGPVCLATFYRRCERICLGAPSFC